MPSGISGLWAVVSEAGVQSPTSNVQCPMSPVRIDFGLWTLDFGLRIHLLTATLLTAALGVEQCARLNNQLG